MRKTVGHLLVVAVAWLLLFAVPIALLRDTWAFAWAPLGMLLVGVPLYLVLGPDQDDR